MKFNRIPIIIRNVSDGVNAHRIDKLPESVIFFRVDCDFRNTIFIINYFVDLERPVEAKLFDSLKRFNSAFLSFSWDDAELPNIIRLKKCENEVKFSFNGDSSFATF